MERHSVYCLLLVVLLLAVARPADAQFRNGIFPTHGDWEDAGNWSPLDTPYAGGFVHIGIFPDGWEPNGDSGNSTNGSRNAADLQQ